MDHAPTSEGGDKVDRTRISPDGVVARFRDAWRRGEQPDIESFLAPAPATQHGDLLRVLIKADMAERFAADEQVRVEHYVARLPQLRHDLALLKELLIEESALRRRHGDGPDTGEYGERFPELLAAPRRPASSHDWNDPSHDAASADARYDENSSALLLGLPSDVDQDESRDGLGAGSTIGDYAIIRSLGEGAIARVYLARQLSLGRLVALKVSANTGDEGRTLASLEHDHIVQVFAEQVVGDQRLMAMRYVPGITLAQLLQDRAGSDRGALTGRDWTEAIDRMTGQPPSLQDTASRAPLDGLSWLRVCCRIVAGLARALEHAHAQHILHRDIKPANILLAQNGRALLMDFNVAARRDASDGTMAGTPAYMAPEHLAAMALLPGSRFAAVDERSDLFSLGVVFYELVTGRHPFRRVAATASDQAALRQMIADRLQGPPAVRSAAVEVPPGIESIVAKCLASDPGARYQGAGDFADDLERFLGDRPLEHAPDTDWSERAGKWWRRNRTVQVSAYALLAAAAVFAIALAVSDWRRLGRAADLLDLAETQLLQGSPLAADMSIKQANRILLVPLTVSRVLGANTSRTDLRRQAARLWKDTSRALIEQFESARDAARLAPAPALDPTRPDAREHPLSLLHVLDRDDWQRQVPFALLGDEERLQVEEDVTEMLVALAIDLLRDDTQRDERARYSRVDDYLRRIPPRFQRISVVQQLHDALRTGTADLAAAPDLPPAEWDEFELYLTGVKELKWSRERTARTYFRAAAARCTDLDRPLKFWAHFQQAECAFRLGLLSEAAKEYGACIGLRGELAWPYVNLGLVFLRDGKLEEAVGQFHDALARDPNLTPAYANLAGALCQLRRFAEAEQICTQAIQRGLRTAEVFCNRGTARAMLGDRAGAAEDFRAALQLRPGFVEASDNLKRLGEDPTEQHR